MGKVIGLLLLLNVVVLAFGLSLEQLRGLPTAPVDFNADKVRLLGRIEPAATEAQGGVKQEAVVVPPTTAEPTGIVGPVRGK